MPTAARQRKRQSGHSATEVQTAFRHEISSRKASDRGEQLFHVRFATLEEFPPRLFVEMATQKSWIGNHREIRFALGKFVPVFVVVAQLQRSVTHMAARLRRATENMGNKAGNTMRDDMKASVFVATSLDGFIARQDGALDWLPVDGGEPHGYIEFMATVDALVIGRKTFETVLTFDAWPYGRRPVVVLSTSLSELTAPDGAVCEVMAGTPLEIVTRLTQRGMRHLYIDCGVTVQGFLEAGLIDDHHADTGAPRKWDSFVRITVTRHPTRTRGHSVVSERFGAERVRDCCLTMPSRGAAASWLGASAPRGFNPKPARSIL